MGTSALKPQHCPGEHPQLTPPFLHLYHTLCKFSHLMHSQAFSRIIWASSQLGLGHFYQWKVCWRSSVAHPSCPGSHRLCALNHSSPQTLFLHQGRSMCVTPIAHQVMPVDVLWETLRKYLFFSCKLPVSQLDSRNMNVYVSPLKQEKIYCLILDHNEVQSINALCDAVMQIESKYCPFINILQKHNNKISPDMYCYYYNNNQIRTAFRLLDQASCMLFKEHLLNPQTSS